ncbi:DUF6134 family protein [uncultured Rhodospira sp.]|uniref:DUF6134 family protein n=1 Tax=uncultured Rhodospira sp. TaxID=1936189 RepID=UPI002636BE97|nr:DUF6134 family protein [uncultured Rhodospira sp.]
MPSGGGMQANRNRRLPRDSGIRSWLNRLAVLVMLALAVGAVAGPAAGAPPGVPDGYAYTHALTYRIFRGDDPIGTSTVEVYARGADRAIVTRTSIDVAVFFYSYTSRHAATEVWENGRLVALKTRTNDDGEAFEVSSTYGPEGLRVSGAAGAYTVPAGVPAKSFWNRDILTASHVITTKRGALEPVQTTTLGRETVEFIGGTVKATRSRFKTDDVIDLWYTDDGLLVKALRDSIGGDILYLLDTTG